MSTVEQLQLLRSDCLFEDCKILAEFILALDDCGKEPLDKDQRIIVYRCQADSAWELQEYRLAEQYYKKTIQAYKQADNKSGDPEWYTEAKYRQHSCLCKLKQPKEALAVLETIPHNQRSSKIYLALGQLYQKNTIDNKNLDAINAYKECLKLNPNSLTAYNSLLSLGIKVNEFLQSPHIQSINDNQNNSLSSFSTSLLKYSWFRTLLQADYAYHTRDYLEATRLYQLIDTEHIQNSPTILCQMGHSQYSNGDYSQALTTLQRAHNVDSQLIKHMDVLAFLIYNESKDWQLERLANHLLSLGDMYSETWIALGYYCLKQINKPNRTVYLAQKAYSLDNKKIQALLLKGLALYKLKRYSDSLVHYKEAIRLTPYCYEAYKGVVDAYLATTRTTEASSFITNAVRTYLTRHVRAFTLCGQVLAKDPLSLEKAKSFLERALNLNQTYVEAVVSLVEVYNQLKQQNKSVELLKEHLQTNNDPRLKQLLVENLMKSGHSEEVLQQVVKSFQGSDLSSPTLKAHIERIEKEMSEDTNGMDNGFDSSRFDGINMDEMDQMRDDVMNYTFSDDDI